MTDPAKLGTFSPAAPSTIPIKVEFMGGLESIGGLHNNLHRIELPSIDPSNNQRVNMAFLIRWTRSNLLKGTKTQQYLNWDGEDMVRPGILVIINDADWELEGELEYELEPDDHVVFVSTLHGG